MTQRSAGFKRQYPKSQNRVGFLSKYRVMEKVLETKTPYRVGQWLSSDQLFLENWIQNLIDEVDRNPRELHPVINEFKEFIEGNPEIYMFFHMMFEQIPYKPPYFQTPTHKPQVRDYQHMLQL